MKQNKWIVSYYEICSISGIFTNSS